MNNNQNPIQNPVQHEPIRINRFRVIFPEQFNHLSYMVSFSNRPSWYNNQWDVIQITFNDVIAPSTKMFLYNLKNWIRDNTCEIKIEDLDPTGTVVSRWVITFNYYQTNFNFGFNDYQNDGTQQLSLSFRPITCVLEI